MNARRLPSGKWRAETEYTDEAGIRNRKSFTRETKKEAEQAALTWLISRRAPDVRTIDEAVDALIISKRPVLSPSTIRSYVGIQRALRERFPGFMSIRIDDLKTKDVQRLVNDLAIDHTPKTIRNYTALIGSALPASVRVFDSVTLPARVRPEYHIPDTNTVQTILAASFGTELEIPILLAVVCTMRAGEIAALSMDDIRGNRIHVHKNMVRNEFQKWVIKTPKTYSSDRYIDAPEWLVEKIRAAGYITDADPSAISYRFGRLLKKHGLPHCRFHDLRHFSASYMHAQGIPTAYIMSRGGWNTETVLNSVYRHALSDRERIETEKINRHFTDDFL